MSMSTQETIAGLRLQSKAVGALPLLNQILKRARIDELLSKFVPARDKRQTVEPAVGLGVLVRNILLSRRPLYDLHDWAQRFDPGLLGLPAGMSDGALNDDRFGRCLDYLFLADRASMLTEVALHVMDEFSLDTSEMHNDSTTVTLSGQYKEADGQRMMGQSTKKVTFGHNKDSRPDLKQLLFILTTTADGAVPIMVNVDHGNTSDDSTHIRTWDSLCKLTGKTSFLYVADSNLYAT